MTRYLSLALGATEPGFGQSISELERAGGQPGADIRLSSELTSTVRRKLVELGLDPQDTTGPELYQALHQKLSHDEGLLRQALHISADAPAADVVASIHTYLSKPARLGSCYGLKASTAKRLLKKKAPKATMKALGYRSLDSMLKHEAMGSIYAAAALVESATWHRALREQYAKLTPSDFEQRPIAIVHPAAKRWVQFAQKYVSSARHNIFCFQELGAVIMLPLPQKLDGLAVTTLVLGLRAQNDIRAYSSFIKLQQVKPTFGKIISQTAAVEPMTSAQLAGQPVSWQVIQRHYGRADSLHPDVFEPHVQPEDLQWTPAEDVLAQVAPELAFWQDTAHVCALYDNQPVSLNVLDVALGYCNNLGFADRIVHFVRQHLWHELMGRYLHQENLEHAVQKQLGYDMVERQALAEF